MKRLILSLVFGFCLVSAMTIGHIVALHNSDVSKPALTAGEPLEAMPRSSAWPTVRAKHLADHPCCEACGSKYDLNVHHVIPFHDRPELELDPDNLITLCNTHCHLVFGHLCNYKSYNPNVHEDVKHYREEVEHRP